MNYLDFNPGMLYRCFDSNDVLLYVGASGQIPSRFEGHRSSSKWFMKVARIEIQHFKSRKQAFEAERKAIKSGNPLYNINKPGGYKGERTPRCVFRIGADAWGAKFIKNKKRYVVGSDFKTKKLAENALLFARKNLAYFGSIDGKLKADKTQK